MDYLELTVIVLSVVVVLILAYLAILTRQVALLHLRVGPTGARITDIGPEIGTRLKTLEADDIFGNSVKLIGDHRAHLLLFVSPSCPACNELIPAAKAVARGYRSGDDAYDVALIATSGDRNANLEYVKRHGLSRIPYVISPTIVAEFGVTGSPYAVVVDADGVVQTKGIVNNVEHLESLLVASRPSPDDIVPQRVTLVGRIAGHGN